MKRSVAPGHQLLPCEPIGLHGPLGTPDHRVAANRHAWRNGFETLPDAEHARNVIPSDAEVRAIVPPAAAENAEFALLVKVLATTGARVSQVARLLVEGIRDNAPGPRLLMPASRKGRDRKPVERRPVPITVDLVTELKLSAAGSHPSGRDDASSG
jgi:hypothetical protein